MIFLNILLIFVLIGLNAFFVSVEFTGVSVRRSRLDLVAHKNSKAAKIVYGWLENQQSRDRLIAASQLGITIVSLALGAVGENTFEHIFAVFFENKHMPAWLSFLEFIIPVLPLLLSLFIVTSLHVVLGEQVPKIATLRDPENYALHIAPIITLFNKIFRWFIDMLDWATQAVLRLLGIPVSTAMTHITSEELKQIVTGPEVAGVLEIPEQKIMTNVINLGDMIVRQIMIPRTEIVALNTSSLIPDAIDAMLENNITKIPVFDSDIDHITGVVRLQDLILTQKNNPDHAQVTLQELKREVLFVPESISINDLLREFRSHKSHLAIVMEEFGGTSGLVTLEDMLEELVGEVSDSAEPEFLSFIPVEEGKTLIDGFTLIEEVNAHFGLNLNSQHYDTIAGLMLDQLDRLAQVGDIVLFPEEGIQLQVVAMDLLRIDQVCLTPLPDTNVSQDANSTENRTG